MPLKLARVLRGSRKTGDAAPTIDDYEESFRLARGRPSEGGENPERTVSDLYYDLVTDFYEYGWGSSFHFAPRVPGESFRESLVRHEHRLVDVLRLGPGMVVADIGSGIGGSLLEIAARSGARIVGVNSNAYQIGRARQLAEEAGLSHLVEFLHCDFLDVDAPDGSFDAVYSIEATCCAPDKLSIYSEIFRLLRPGASFAAYEYALTERFDPGDPRHLELQADIQLGGGLVEIATGPEIDGALREVGFEVIETRDLAVQEGPSIPWYRPLVGSGLSLAAFRSSRVGRALTRHSLRLLEALRLAPRGSVRVVETLDLCADAMAESGRLGIFTPMYFIHARKPG